MKSDHKTWILLDQTMGMFAYVLNLWLFAYIALNS